VVALAVLVCAACSSGPDTTTASDRNAVPADGNDGDDASESDLGGLDSPSDPGSAGLASSTAEELTDELEPPDQPDPQPSGPDELPWPQSGRELAASLTEAEAAIRDTNISDREASAWGWRQQRLYRMLVDNPAWVAEGLDLPDPVLRRAAELNWEAQEHLVRLGNSHGAQPVLPAWRVNPPRPVEELLGYYRLGEAEHGIDWTYLAAINLVETRMGRIEGLSTAGAVGPMQFLPTTWAECCEGDATNPADAIPGAARYLVARGGPDNMERALWGYNNSDHYVGAITAYATVMSEDPLAYRGYHGWEVMYRSTAGVVHIPVGYEETEPIPADVWVADNPDQVLVPVS
jgi:hypothetical protein